MAGYINVPFESDVETLTAEALDALTTNIPGFVPREGHVEVWMVEVWARMVAEAATVASSASTAIFRYFGASLLDLPSVAAAAARVTTTWTMVDAQGYTIPAGTVIAFRVAGDELIPFTTVSDAVAPPGSTTVTGVVAEAVDVGVSANGLGPGGMELVDALSFVDTVVASDASGGGVDEESDDAYLDRLTAELRLLAPRPILPEDFAVLARRVAGVHRAIAIDGHDPGLNELQTVTVSSATGGTFTLTFDANTTAGIAYNATDAAVQSALEALANINVGDVLVTGGAVNDANGVIVEFTGQYASTNVAQITADGAALTGAGAAVAVATSQEGVAPSNNNERMVSVAAVDVDGNAINTTVKAELVTSLEEQREVNFVVHVIGPTYTTVNVTFTVVAFNDFELADVQDRAVAAVSAYIDPASWGGGDESPPEWRTTANVVRYLEVAQVLNEVDGVNYVDALTVNGATTDLALGGVAPLPAVGTVTGTAQHA